MSDMTAVATAQTLLFVPGNRHDRFAKALAAGADLVVFDLEDAVPAEEKARARNLVVSAVASAQVPVAVRINGVDTEWFQDDVESLADSPAHLMLPKTERLSDIEQIGLGADGSRSIIALIETPLGIANATELAAAPGVVRLAFGSLDYAASLGISPNDRNALLFARLQLVNSSGVAKLSGPIDGVTQDVREPALTFHDMDYAKGLGFTGKLCIHPAQLEATAKALQPTEEEIAWARTIVAAAGSEGVVVVDGRMVDAPVVKRAENIMAYVNARSGYKSSHVLETSATSGS